MSRVNRPHILCQTGIRGLAALSVVPSHLGLKYMFPESGATIAGFFPSGIAVNFFFVLSGFILCYVYMHDGRFSGSWNKFYRARFARIYPLYLCLILVGYLANLLAGTGGAGVSYGKDLLKTIVQLSMLHPYPGIEFGGWIIPSWSLAMEFLAYIVIFPALVTGLGKIRSAAAVWCLITLIVALFFVLGAFVGWKGFLSWGALLRISTFFPLGMTLFQLTQVAPNAVEYFSKRASFFSFALVGFFLVDKLLVRGVSFYSEWFLLLLVFCFLKDSKTLACRFLALRPIQWLGKVSYSIYLFHILFGWILVQGIGSEWFSERSLVENLGFICFQVVVILLGSELLYRWVEVPGKHMVLSLFKRFEGKIRFSVLKG